MDINTEILENRIFAEIALGDSASLSKTISSDDIALFSYISGDVNPAHLDKDYAASDLFHHIIAQGVLTAGLISAVLGTKLPGPGTIYLGQELRFHAPVSPGDTITAKVIVTELIPEKHRVILDCHCFNQDGKDVLSGTATVQAPTEKISRPAIALPEVRLLRHEFLRNLLTKATSDTPLPTAIAYPCDETSLLAVTEAAARGLITPILVGPTSLITAKAAEYKLDISAFRIEEAASSSAAAKRAVALAHEGIAKALMKGALHTDELLHEVVQPGTGLRTGNRLSHVYVMDVPSYPKPLLITDAAINIQPDLEDKHSIVLNAISLAHSLGIETPRVAILAAVETVNPAMQATLDAAALCKMADRGQINSAILDGPLAFDNAISATAAAQKHIISPVAGQADILVVPDIESGNMLAKQLTFLANADAAGIVLGASVPIILTSRADNDRARLASCAIAVMMAGAHG
ncbi:bifunctional enoyl-CoA hydratase/phosphate acetyltransferase [Acidocella aminolytica]|uniref:Bifunctional enoyl-CoA hydratase/phosphate acetyltransferase n=1 Tax=Acidocella aminolytica 101 = DSM 11237 TaxID=1120923 RepID=A0A0D6PIY2_9PROT|nr:bifunctional enoyl-CoA hydratase/phosphate acetyltransferase [Acidocella aminolytica]GAN81346.1 bifunctional enoyl-CoA hydratase/phosphate acetyltransferase [Acidocella aminolytica 101 = DSM 11237]GBQ33623.1 phosphate acetyl/butaryl transferase [Acidocella aminolytica 101 = DSM 11237]SHF42668.1 phosphate butyryltransferase [Acidocella aminolytica 101 = DSM 11237]